MTPSETLDMLYPPPTPRIRWTGIIFFLVIHAAAVFVFPFYAWHHGISGLEWTIFGVYTALSGMAITMGYHRLFAHAAFKTGPVIRFVLLFFGASTFEQSALKWASQHRQHHQFVDTDRDPYTIKKGFWYAHINWIIFFKHKVNYKIIADLQKDPMIFHQHRYEGAWAVTSGIILPTLLGYFSGNYLTAFLLNVCVRLVIVMNSAFFINSFAHTFGSRTYDKTISARDHWLGAILTNGEGYHNFHHRFPSDYRNGVKWHHWDPSKWLIYGLSLAKLTWDLKKTPPDRIAHAEKITAA